MKLFNILSNMFFGYFNLIKFKLYKPYRLRQQTLFSKRLNICESCKFVNLKIRQCKKCGCFIDAKTKVIYKLDEDDYAVCYIDPLNGDIYYACPKKLW